MGKTNWVGTPLDSYSNFKSLRALASANLKIKPLASDNAEELMFELENAGQEIIFFVELLLKNEQGGVIYPVYWEDNYFSLMPNEKKTITCKVNQQLIDKKTAFLQVRGWTIKEENVNLK